MWPKNWSFSYSISPSNEYSGLISFRIDWLDLLAVQRTLKSVLQHHSSKASIFRCSAFFIVQLSYPYMTIGKAIALTRQNFVGKVISPLFNMLSRNGMDLTEAEDIKKRWQEYTEDLYQRDLHNPDNHEDVITHTHLEPDILECEVSWALGSITMNKASGSDGIPVALFQIVKDGAVTVLNRSANLDNSAVAIRLEKVNFHSNPKERQCQRMLELPHNCTHLTTSKVMLKILQARLQQDVNREL